MIDVSALVIKVYFEMDTILSFFTIPRIVYWVLSLNLVIMLLMLVKKDLVSVIIKHKQRAQALCVLSVFSLAVFIQGK